MIAVDECTITTIVDNSIDMLLPGDAGWSRFGLIEHFDARQQPVQAEFGIAFLIEVVHGSQTHRVMFDAGLTSKVVQHNMRSLQINAGQIEHIAISHGHPDHYGGLIGALELIGHRVPVATHDDAFLPRYAIMPDGRVSAYYNGSLDRAAIASMGGTIVTSREALTLAPGVMTTGEIPREVDFEGPRPADKFQGPGLYQVRDGALQLDEVHDEVGCVVNVRDLGIVVLTGCAHAGVINTIRAAQRLTGESRVAAIMGGFHLGFPTTPAANVSSTITALREIGPMYIVPMHCTGLKATAAILEGLPGLLVQSAVGTRFRYSASSSTGSLT